MEGLSKLISAFAALSWPLVIGIVLYKLREPIHALLDSARGRKFTIRVAGNELTMEEASDQQRVILTDLQNKIAELEKHIEPKSGVDDILRDSSRKSVLWVDDNPRNNSYIVASLEARNVAVDLASSTNEALAKFNKAHYDFIISDMGRPESDKAAKNLRSDALKAGAAEITSSGTTLLTALPL
jgi:PleD family two-component response regulator